MGTRFATMGKGSSLLVTDVSARDTRQSPSRLSENSSTQMSARGRFCGGLLFLVVLLIIRPVLRHGSAWDWRRPSGRAAKQLREEARPASVAASGPAAPRIVRQCLSIIFVLDGNIRNLPFGPIQYGKQRMIAAINILAKFELALIIDESGLVSQVDWDKGRKRDVAFVGAIHPVNAVLGVAFTWPHYRQQHLGIFHGILYPHAAVAFGTPIIGEKLFLVREPRC